MGERMSTAILMRLDTMVGQAGRVWLHGRTATDLCLACLCGLVRDAHGEETGACESEQRIAAVRGEPKSHVSSTGNCRWPDAQVFQSWALISHVLSRGAACTVRQSCPIF
jgi:hypothetical protein